MKGAPTDSTIPKAKSGETMFGVVNKTGKARESFRRNPEHSPQKAIQNALGVGGGTARKGKLHSHGRTDTCTRAGSGRPEGKAFGKREVGRGG